MVSWVETDGTEAEGGEWEVEGKGEEGAGGRRQKGNEGRIQ